MIRSKAIKMIMKEVKTTDIVVSSAGMISRELFNVCDRPRNFYVQGSMGATLGIGIGIALNTNDKVIVIAGDGDILMNLENLVMMKKLDLPNLVLYILDNNQYSSTGGQKTISDAIVFEDLAECHRIMVHPCKGRAKRISLTHEEIMERFMNAVR